MVSYGFVRFSYGSNRPPRWSVGFRVRFRMVFLWFSYGFVRFSYGSNRPPRWSVGFRVRFRMVFLWFHGFVRFSYGSNCRFLPKTVANIEPTPICVDICDSSTV